MSIEFLRSLERREGGTLQRISKEKKHACTRGKHPRETRKEKSSFLAGVSCKAPPPPRCLLQIQFCL